MLQAGRTALLRSVPATLVMAASAFGQSLQPGTSPAPQPPRVVKPQLAPAAPRAPQPPAPPHSRLEVGDTAPPLGALTWLRGTPVKELANGTTYVIEFWAPWCPDCRASLNVYANLAQRYAGKPVTLLAVAVWPKPTAPEMARDFVSDADDLFPYAVAQDVDNGMAKSWLTAANVSIPSAFIVDGDGRIDWIGDPREGLPEALTQSLGEAALHAAVMSGRTIYRVDIDKANGAVGRGDWKLAAELSKHLYEKAPGLLPDFAARHYVALVMLGELEAAKAWGEQLVSADFANQPKGLNLLAWDMVEPDGSLPKDRIDLDLALRAASRADDLTDHSDPFILDTLARVQFLRGDLADALRLQLHAVEEAATLGRMVPDAAAIRKDLAERLAQYQAAAEASDDRSTGAPRRSP